MNEDEDIELPFFITYNIGHLPDGDIAIQITYSTSAERHEARQWDTAVYAMDRQSAIEFGKALLRETGELPPDDSKRKIVRN